jgi:PST family polysaccharide transporter
LTARAAPAPDTLRQNLLALYLLQAANYGIPLLVLPFLVRAVGVERFGLIAFAQTVVQYFVFAVDAGFNNNATREIAVRRGRGADPVLEIYWATQAVRAGVLLLATAAFALLLVRVPALRTHWQLYLLSYATVPGTFLFSAWLYQGLERMRLMAALQVAGRVAAAVALVLLVRRPEDYLLAAGVQASATLVSGALGLAVCLRSGVLRWRRPSAAAVRRTLAQGGRLFWSELLSTCVSGSGVFVLGLVASSASVGAYAAIEKLVRALMTGYLPISQALLPQVAARLAATPSPGRMWRRLGAMTGGLFAAAVFGAALVSLQAGGLLVLAFGPGIAGHASLLSLMIWVLPIDVLNVTVGQLFVFAAGHRDAYVRALAAGAAVQAVLSLALAAPAGGHGVAAAFLAAELWTLAMLLRALLRIRRGAGRRWRRPLGGRVGGGAVA